MQIPSLILTITPIVAYLIGSIPCAVLISKGLGLQSPYTYGSGNPGTTNVLRSGNRIAAMLTLFGDIAKGWLAVWLMLAFGARLPSPVFVLGVLSVILGHLYPVFSRFSGGKGIATSLGILIAMQPWLAFIAAVTWLVTILIFRYSSLSSLITVFLSPFYYLLGSDILWELSLSYFYALILVTPFLFYRHHANILRLSKGTEPHLGS